MPKIRLVEADGAVHELEATAGETLMQVATDNLVPGILGECGGACACATCHVYISAEHSQKLDAPSDMELGMLEGTAEDATQQSRLACQIIIGADWDGFEAVLPAKQI